MKRREIPTHLHVEDKLIAGLTVRQVLFLSVGVSVGYSLWLHLAWLAHVPALAHVAALTALLRVALAALPVLAMTICVLVRPAGRPLEDWLPVVLRYAVLPKAAVWRSAYPTREDEVSAAYSTRSPRLPRFDGAGEEAGDWPDLHLDGSDGEGARWDDEIEGPMSIGLDAGGAPPSFDRSAPRGDFLAAKDRRNTGQQRIGRMTGTQGSMHIAVRLASGARSARREGAAVTSSLADARMPADSTTPEGATSQQFDAGSKGGVQ